MQLGVESLAPGEGSCGLALGAMAAVCFLGQATR